MIQEEAKLQLSDSRQITLTCMLWKWLVVRISLCTVPVSLVVKLLVDHKVSPTVRLARGAILFGTCKPQLLISKRGMLSTTVSCR